MSITANIPANPEIKFRFSIPNIITSVRVILALVIFTLIAMGSDSQVFLAGVLLIAAACTDWLDGFMSRRLKQSSLFGSLFDLCADQFLFMPTLVLAMMSGLFTRADGLFVLNPYLYAVPALLGGVFVIAGVIIYLIKRRKMEMEFPTPTMMAKINFWFWLAPLFVAVFKAGPDLLLAILMYLAVISTVLTFYSYLKKGGYVFTK